MLRVGVTGGVGSGKSVVTGMLRDLGAHVSQSDEIGRTLMQTGQPAYTAILDYFGSDVLAADGSLDRSVLARIAFQDGRVEELNGIVHPLVIAEQTRWASAVEAANPDAIAVIESALIFETRHAGKGEVPWRTRFDRIVVVTAPLQLRRQRSVGRGMSEHDFERRAAAQWPDEQKMALADFVVTNDGSLKDLKLEVERLWRILRAEASDRTAESM